MKETSALVVHVLAHVIKIKPEYLYGVPWSPCYLALYYWRSLLSCQEYSYFHAYGGLGVSKICVESKFVAYSRAGRSGVVPRTSAILL